jgi:hypothetical protein
VIFSSHSRYHVNTFSVYAKFLDGKNYDYDVISSTQKVNLGLAFYVYLTSIVFVPTSDEENELVRLGQRSVDSFTETLRLKLEQMMSDIGDILS